MLSATVPIWMAEVVPAKIRGMLVDSHGAMYIFGYMLAAWIGYGFYFVDAEDSWRGPFGRLQAICLPSTIALTSISNSVSGSSGTSAWNVLASGVTKVALDAGQTRTSSQGVEPTASTS